MNVVLNTSPRQYIFISDEKKSLKKDGKKVPPRVTARSLVVENTSEAIKENVSKMDSQCDRNIFFRLASQVSLDCKKEEEYSSYSGFISIRSTNGKVERLDATKLQRKDFMLGALPTHLCTEAHYGRNIFGMITVTKSINSSYTKAELKATVKQIIENIKTKDSGNNVEVGGKITRITNDYTFQAQLMSTSVTEPFGTILNHSGFIQEIEKFHSKAERYGDESIVAFKFSSILHLEPLKSKNHHFIAFNFYSEETREMYSIMTYFKRYVKELQTKAIEEKRSRNLDLTEYRKNNIKCWDLVNDMNEKLRDFRRISANVSERKVEDNENKLTDLLKSMIPLQRRSGLKDEYVNAIEYLEKFVDNPYAVASKGLISIMIDVISSPSRKRKSYH